MVSHNFYIPSADRHVSPLLWRSMRCRRVCSCSLCSFITVDLPFFYFCLLDVFDVAEQYAAHRHIFGFLVIVSTIGTVALFLPLFMACVGAWSLDSYASTRPQAAQIPWVGSWLRGLPQMHFKFASETSMRNPMLKSYKFPYPREWLTLTRC